MEPDSIVFGASGFIGRFLVAELLRRGSTVAAAVRGGGDALTAWLSGQEVPLDKLSVVRADITHPDLGLPPDALKEVRDVYNCAGRYAFGLSVEEARATNVTGALHVLDWAATRPGLRRLVHVSGYRVSGAGGGSPDYRRLGAYEASKVEGDAAVRAGARERGVPLSVANPSTVIGPGQFVGLASVVADLWRGRLPAVPGGRDVFVPVVDAAYLAAFLAGLPEQDGGRGEAYWLLDDRTPVLPELIKLLAAHTGVRAPRRTIPVGLLRRLPRALTRADPETLSFLSTDRYDTGPAEALAGRMGLRPPPVETALRTWADDLVATRFGTTTAPPRPYGYQRVAGTATWITGDRARPAHVLLHGLPLDSDSWREVADRLDGPVLTADLPGLGRSGPAHAPVTDWVAELLSGTETGARPVLVAHSLACVPAVRYAAAHPERVARLVLVAPAFLQAPSPWLSRTRAAALLLRRMSAPHLAATLGVPEGPAVAAAAADLSRPGQARRVVAALRAAHAVRHELRELLTRVNVPVEIVVGSADPLTVPVDRPVTTIAGAGHYPQLTHPDELAAALR
ncbi:putative NAD dependent epimerase/dehydratase family protein [[Actinomadura] parvosata subsp. kistnae]|uniref:NAD-dependent dehydratase n=1 Tax=[Actinomadura] parvosata subsp. kistnae TaxID=1909395 RepID=A0A1U9ZXE0_9ACTN|nr:alpha/beta fold hydrolase [Nonomuraea sp. ATCC 55076]AQZ62608.1 NAD-dependent dehydratase [Nonomuraea sp. ATCC 55076]SPL88892.1 putative NAD dependent epimerase/dehydratase family protein [Actinomadura parvosata subsp. kistnae]